jgi:hypothetical protein
MDDYFDEVERQLSDLCKQRARRRRRWLRLSAPFPGSAPGLVASSLVVVAVAALALGLLHSGGSGSNGGPSPGASFGQLPPAQRRAVDNYLRAVVEPVDNQHPACNALRGRSSRAAGLGTPTASLLSTLGVLRRPQAATDTLPHTGPSRPGNIYRRYVRRARGAFGAAYYVIPTFTTVRADAARCVALLQAQFGHELARVPTALKTAFREQFELLLAQDRPHDLVYLFALGPKGSGWAFDVTAAQVQQGNALSTNPVSPAIYGLVPDGVANVTLQVLAIPSHGGAARIVVVNASVVSNVIVANPPRGYKSFGAVRTWVWHATDGRAIKTITKPQGPGSSEASGPPHGIH